MSLPFDSVPTNYSVEIFAQDLSDKTHKNVHCSIICYRMKMEAA